MVVYNTKKEKLEVIEKFENYLRGYVNINNIQVKQFSEKGGMDFIRSITSLLSSALDNLEAELTKQEVQKQIKQNLRAAKILIFHHVNTNFKDGILEEDMVPIYQAYTNLVVDTYRGLKRDGKYKKFLEKVLPNSEESEGEE